MFANSVQPPSGGITFALSSEAKIGMSCIVPSRCQYIDPFRYSTADDFSGSSEMVVNSSPVRSCPIEPMVAGKGQLLLVGEAHLREDEYATLLKQVADLVGKFATQQGFLVGQHLAADQWLDLSGLQALFRFHGSYIPEALWWLFAVSV